MLEQVMYVEKHHLLTCQLPWEMASPFLADPGAWTGGLEGSQDRLTPPGLQPKEYC